MNLAHDTGYFVVLTSRSFMRVAEARLRPLGLGIAYMPVIAALADQDSMTQSEIAVRAQIEQPTAAALLKRMDAAGLIDRVPDPRDRRSTRISLSSRGADLLPEALARRTAAIAEATASLTPMEVDVLNGLLARVLTNLETMIDEMDAGDK